MNTSDRKIAEVLGKFGEPMAGNVWRVQGTAVIYHKTLERIAALAKVRFDDPKIIRAERDEAVIQVTGHLDERTEWSIGEALIGVNYRVSGKQAAYVYAIAEKRAKDRVILKLIELHGYLYSEEEADEFKQSRGRDVESEPEIERETTDRHPQARGYDVGESKRGEPTADGNPEDDLKAKIRKAKTINAVTDLMLHTDTQKVLADLPEGIRDEIRDFAKARLVELGWPTKSQVQVEPPPQIRQQPEDRHPPEDETHGNGGLEPHPPKAFSPEESKTKLKDALTGLKKVKSWDDLKGWAGTVTTIRPRLMLEHDIKLDEEYQKVKALYQPRR